MLNLALSPHSKCRRQSFNFSRQIGKATSFVIGASVATAWLLQEEDSGTAEAVIATSTPLLGPIAAFP
jgi:hypothetical protein